MIDDINVTVKVTFRTRIVNKLNLQGNKCTFIRMEKLPSLLQFSYKLPMFYLIILKNKFNTLFYQTLFSQQ